MPSVVTAEEAIDHLRGADIFADVTELDKLTRMIDSATSACESYVRHPIALVTVTERLAGWSDRPLVLGVRPVVDITNVTESGLALVAGTDYQLEKAGLLYRVTASGWNAWASISRSVVVTYRAGYINPPADVKMAVLREVEHLWQRTQNAPHPGLGDDNYDEMMRNTTSAIPWPVRYLLDPYRFPGGFA